MTQFYIVEIQQYANGEFGHIVHYVWDENPDQARLKAESKYSQVLSAAAVSDLPSHAAILFSSEGFPVMNQCYHHTVQPEAAPAPEPEEPEETPEENPEEETEA